MPLTLSVCASFPKLSPPTKKNALPLKLKPKHLVAQTHLNATKRKLSIFSEEEEEASISQQKAIETARAVSMADIAEEQAASERRRDEARIAKESWK